ncbi:hypothetical protein DEO72_LG4g504 [Vigna unguiculata]|uniref:Uncharacterized protein n=1 Tax=Vigna unguiculata TaxID=3917 RepID=A0A4D6LM65_VIGUN|nr:hypothetical protein DEO72_LG4g504 [Vigna unguiculata]
MFGSGIFPKTAWRVVTDRQATHIFCVRFGRRTAWQYTPNRKAARRRVINASVSAILFRLPGGDEFPPGDTNQFSLIFMIWDAGEGRDSQSMELMNCGKIGSWCNIQSSHNFENEGVPRECRNRLAVRRWPPGAVTVGCGQYEWVQLDCPPQLLADEFGSLGTLRTMFIIGNSTWRYGV